MLSDPPGPEEFEVSLFGPGKGESLAIHLGCGEWIVVDSCVDQRSNSVPVLEYFKRIGVDVEKAVKLVVGTHAHDDHIAGISRVLDASKSAYFVSSAATVTKEFLALARKDQLDPDSRTSVYSEYRSVFGIIKERSKGMGHRLHRFAVQGRPLLELPMGGQRRHHAVVLPLSPSDEAFARSLSALDKELPRVGTERRTDGVDPNELAIALWVEVGSQRALLGADLLIGPEGCGWKAVVSTFAPEQSASLLKVPHHGAPNAHHGPMWESLLTEQPVAVVAPYRPCRTARPSPADITRICSLTSHAYITASPKVPAPPRTVKRSAKTLNQVGRNVREPWGRVGHVRARCSAEGGPWTVEWTSPARRLCS